MQLVTVLVPGAVFHLYAACKNIDQEEILERPIYTVFYIISVLLRIILEVIAFWLQSHLFGFQVNLIILSVIIPIIIVIITIIIVRAAHTKLSKGWSLSSNRVGASAPAGGGASSPA